MLVLQAITSDESGDQKFLKYIGLRYKKLKSHETAVTLMVDEIDIQPYIDYKEGKTAGAAVNTVGQQ